MRASPYLRKLSFCLFFVPLCLIFIFMNQLQYTSRLLEEATNELGKLPGIGRKTALRLALHILKHNSEYAIKLGEAIIKLKEQTVYCKKCHNISDSSECPICSNPNRDGALICVVENTRDVMAIENTNQFKGKYHVLGGIISPMEGVGPDKLTVESLVSKAEQGLVKEVILALSTTMEGDTTNFYIYRKLKPFNVKITTIARGIAIGDELEYADEVTLGRSIVNRTDFEQNLKM